MPIFIIFNVVISKQWSKYIYLILNETIQKQQEILDEYF